MPINLYRSGDPDTLVMEVHRGFLNYLEDKEGSSGSCLVIFDGEGSKSDLAGKEPEAAVVLGFESGRMPYPGGYDQKVVLRLGEEGTMTLNKAGYTLRNERVT